MPALPTINIPQGQFDRVVAAFPGDTLAAKAANYQAWLTGQLIDFVRQAEIRAIDEETNVTRTQRLAAVEAGLPPRPQFPV